MDECVCVCSSACMCNWLYHVMLFNTLVWVFLCVCIPCICVCAPLGRREEFMTKPEGEQHSQNKHTVGTDSSYKPLVMNGMLLLGNPL